MRYAQSPVDIAAWSVGGSNLPWIVNYGHSYDIRAVTWGSLFQDLSDPFRAHVCVARAFVHGLWETTWLALPGVPQPLGYLELGTRCGSRASSVRGLLFGNE